MNCSREIAVAGIDYLLQRPDDFRLVAQGEVNRYEGYGGRTVVMSPDGNQLIFFRRFELRLLEQRAKGLDLDRVLARACFYLVQACEVTSNSVEGVHGQA